MIGIGVVKNKSTLNKLEKFLIFCALCVVFALFFNNSFGILLLNLGSIGGLISSILLIKSSSRTVKGSKALNTRRMNTGITGVCVMLPLTLFALFALTIVQCTAEYGGTC